MPPLITTAKKCKTLEGELVSAPHAASGSLCSGAMRLVRSAIVTNSGEYTFEGVHEHLRPTFSSPLVMEKGAFGEKQIQF